MNIFLTFLILVSAIYADKITPLKENLNPITIEAPFEWNSMYKNQLKHTDNNTHSERAVQIQETANGFRQPIYRGLQGDQINLTVDDFSFTNSMFRSGPNQYYSFIPSEFVQKISLKKDVDDLSNNSFGGTIDRQLGFLQTNKNIISVQNYISGGKIFTSYEHNDIKLGALYKKINYIDTPSGKISHSNYNQKGIYLEKNKYKLIYTRSDDIDRTDKFEKNKPRIYAKQYYLGLFKSFEVNYDYTIKASYQNFYENVNNPRNDIDKIDKSNNNIYQIMNEYYINDNLILSSKHKWEDITYDKYNKDSKKYEVYDNSISLDYFKNFNNVKYSISINGDYANIATKNYHNIGAGIKAQYKNYYVNISQGYKYPTIFNLNEAVSDSLYEIPNNNLKKETSVKTEIGYMNHTKYIQYKCTVFYNKLNDMITREQTNILSPDGSYMYKVTNSNKGKTYGINTNIVYTYHKFILDFFGEYVYGKTDIDYISKITPFRTDTRIEYYNFGIIHKYAIRSHTLSKADKSDIRIKNHNYGYNQFDISYTYHFVKNYIVFSVKNITNNTGRVLGSSSDFNRRYGYIKIILKY